MKWSFSCPICSELHTVNWENHGSLTTCPNTDNNYIIPTPSQQHEAYVDTHNWPLNMENVVLILKGSVCTVPGCKHPYETLDHRVPFSKGGKTSVSNLFPMCNKHNLSKGDEDYYLWQITQP